MSRKGAIQPASEHLWSSAPAPPVPPVLEPAPATLAPIAPEVPTVSAPAPTALAPAAPAVPGAPVPAALALSCGFVLLSSSYLLLC